ncbi:MAG: M23 family metallopeptidase, partial [Bacteriovorax sp.]
DKASDRIAYARLIVGSALVEKELRLDPTTNLETLVNKLPELEDRQFLSPVKAERISSQFNLARRHPVKRRRIQPHNGVDFTAKSSTPVYPALEGVVIAMGRARAKGKFILIEHYNGMKSTYDHLRKFQKGLRIGDYVEVGDQIGEVGRTGYATGSHLHFGLLNEDGLYVNPILYLKDYQVETDDGHGPDSGSLDEFDEAPGLEAEY